MDLQWALARSPDFVQTYVNALKAGRALGGQAPPAPDPAAAIAALGEAERAQAARRAEVLGAVGTGLLQAPYGRRSAILAHLTPALAAQGLDPRAIADFDPTDANLGAHVANAMSLASQLATPASVADAPAPSVAD